MSSIRLSVCHTGGSGPQDNYPNTLALGSPKAIHLLPGEHGKILGRLEVEWEKVACWSTKAAISLKRVKKIKEKLLWRATNALSNGTTAGPLRPQDWGFATLQNFNRYYLMQERVKLQTSNLAGTFKGSIRNLEKRERGRIHGLHIFSVPTTPSYLKKE